MLELNINLPSWRDIRHRLFTPSNRLKIKTLPRRWTDRDHMLLHAAFQVLVDFMEQEMPGVTIDWDWDWSHKHAWNELNELYQWWTTDPLARDDDIIWEFPEAFGSICVPADKFVADHWIYRAITEPKFPGHLHLSIEAYADEVRDAQLKRLIDVRRFMWT